MEHPQRIAWRHRSVVSTLAGLGVAWGGVLLVLGPAGRLLGLSDRLLTDVLAQLYLWLLAGLIVVIVVHWERQPLASLNLRPFHWSSVTWGLLLAVVVRYVVMPPLIWAVQAAGLPGFEPGMSRALEAPIGLRAFQVVTAGVVEDTLFIGYAYTRLARLTGSGWFAGALAVTVMALLHLSNWGMGPVLIYLATGSVYVAFFAWRRDLLANITAHTTVDALALVIVPLLADLRVLA